ncbi:MAG: ABC transporter ATP-binding protein [Clostridiales bacterium]|jgi:ABC-2 type transport system ATP-binding protein|nr:ABC transporter ATP-binding protein [Clostridiales bacterium]
MEPILEITHVSKTYGKKEALKGVSLKIEPGKVVGLLGPNGSGKSTLIKLINGLLQPTDGQILVAGQALGIETKKMISYLPERTYLNEWMKVKDLLGFFSDFYEDFDREKARQMLATLKIDEDSKLKTLSKGTKEKVQLILVMSRKAKLYILDEPIGGVDPAARDYILNTIIKNYSEESSVIIATHLIQEVENICDDIIFLGYGEIRLQGNVDDIRQEKGQSIDALFREVFRC